jgi:hypothetical protein
MGGTNQAINDMTSIGVVATIYTLTSNEIHNLMLSLAWNTRIREDDLDLHKG